MHNVHIYSEKNIFISEKIKSYFLNAGPLQSVLNIFLRYKIFFKFYNNFYVSDAYFYCILKHVYNS